MELAALELLKISHRLIMGKCCLQASLLDRISHFVVTCPCWWIKFSIDILWCLHLFSVVFNPILFILAGNEDMHKISEEYDFRPDWTTDYGVSCPWASKNVHLMGKRCLQASSFIFDWIFIKLAGNQEAIKSQMSSNSGWIESVTSELLAHKGQIKYSIDILWNLQVQLTFQTLEFLVTLFSGTVRFRKLKLGTLAGSGQIYHVYWNQAAAAYSSLYFFIFLSPIFNIEIFRHTFLAKCEA